MLAEPVETIDHAAWSAFGHGGVVGWTDIGETTTVTRALAARDDTAADRDQPRGGALEHVWPAARPARTAR